MQAQSMRKIDQGIQAEIIILALQQGADAWLRNVQQLGGILLLEASLSLMVSEIVVINSERSFRFSWRTGSSSSASPTLSNCVFLLMSVASRFL